MMAARMKNVPRRAGKLDHHAPATGNRGTVVGLQTLNRDRTVVGLQTITRDCEVVTRDGSTLYQVPVRPVVNSTRVTASHRRSSSSLTRKMLRALWLVPLVMMLYVIAASLLLLTFLSLLHVIGMTT